MTTKLNRAEILGQLLRTLIEGWGHSAVQGALDDIGETKPTRLATSKELKERRPSDAAIRLVSGINISGPRAALLRSLAVQFDRGDAFPTMADAKAFLLSRNGDARNLKTRNDAFKRMVPFLLEMSEKGLEKVISRSHHTGPADLLEISQAIRGAGESLRGHPKVQQNDAGDLRFGEERRIYTPESSD